MYDKAIFTNRADNYYAPKLITKKLLNFVICGIKMKYIKNSVIQWLITQLCVKDSDKDINIHNEFHV